MEEKEPTCLASGEGSTVLTLRQKPSHSSVLCN